MSKKEKNVTSKKPVDGRFVAGIVFLVGAVIFLAYKIFLLSFIFLGISVAFFANRISKIVPVAFFADCISKVFLKENVIEKQSIKTFEKLKKLSSKGLKKPMDAKKYYLNLLKLRFILERHDPHNQLGNVYESIAGLMFYGIGTLVNRQKAFEYYEKAYDLGCEDAAVDLGNLYLYGVHVEKNAEKAMSYLIPLAEKENEFALEALEDYKNDPDGTNFKELADIALERNDKKIKEAKKYVNGFSVALAIDILLWILVYITDSVFVIYSALIGAVVVGVLYVIKFVGVDAFIKSWDAHAEHHREVTKDIWMIKNEWNRYK